MIHHPIVRRELLGLLRLRRTLLLQVGLVLALALLVIVRWPSEAVVGLSGAQSAEVFAVFAFGSLVLLMLMAPIFPATSLVRERQTGTLTLLLQTELGRWSITLGKLVAVCGFAFLLLLLTLPIAAACVTMGGLDLQQQVLAAYAVLTLLIVQYASIGLLISSYASSTDSALRTTYLVIVVIAVLSVAPFLLEQGRVRGVGAEALLWIQAMSPIPAMLEVVGRSHLLQDGLLNDYGMVERFATTAFASSVVCIVLTAMRLSPWMDDRARSAGEMTEDRSRGVRLWRRILFLWWFDPQRRTGAIGRFTNPVVIKEIRSRRYGRIQWIMRLAAGAFVLSLAGMLLVANASQAHGVEAMGASVVILQTALILLIAPGLGCGLVSGEFENGSWSLLQMTRLSTLQIGTGKLLSIAWALAVLLVVTLPAYAVMMYVDPSNIGRVARVLVTLGLLAIFAMCLSAAASGIFRRTGAAMAATYTVLITLCAGTLLVWMGEGDPFSPKLVAQALLFNPVAAALSLIGVEGFENYRLYTGNWYFLALASAGCLCLYAFQIWRLLRPH